MVAGTWDFGIIDRRCYVGKSLRFCDVESLYLAEVIAQLARPASMQSNAVRERKEQRANYTLKRVALKTSDVES